VPWTLHPQLDSDTTAVGDLPLSRLLLANDANYPLAAAGAAAFSARARSSTSSQAEQIALAAEIAGVSRALKGGDALRQAQRRRARQCVPQLHVHVIARRRGDSGLAETGCGAPCPRATMIRRSASAWSPPCGPRTLAGEMMGVADVARMSGKRNAGITRDEITRMSLRSSGLRLHFATIILRSVLLRASRRMAARTPCRASVLRDAVL